MQRSGTEPAVDTTLGTTSRVADEVFARCGAGSGLGEAPTAQDMGTVRLRASPDPSSAARVKEPPPAGEDEGKDRPEAVAAAGTEPNSSAASWPRRVAWCCLLAGCLLLPAPLLRLVGPGRPAKGPQGGAEKERLTGGSRAKAIDAIVVGDRVLAKHPQGEEDTALGEEVDQATWRRVDLRAAKRDGSWAEVVLLRPEAWLESQGARVGGTLRVAVPECGIDGNAGVLAISPCAPIRTGAGRVVIGTFKHLSARVVDLYIEGVDDPVGTTVTHPFWSEDRQRFVPAGELKPGERLLARDGSPRVHAVLSRGEPVPVYNIEVQGAHVYQVARLGLLVHNGGTLPNGLGSGLGGTPLIGGVYVFFSDDGNKRTAYIGSAVDIWDRVAGAREPSKAKLDPELAKRAQGEVYNKKLVGKFHEKAVDALGREGTKLLLFQIDDLPSTSREQKAILNTQEQRLKDDLQRLWESQGLKVDWVNKAPARTKERGSAYDKGETGKGKLEGDELTKRLEANTKLLADKKELVDELVKRGYVSAEARDKPLLLSKYEVDMIRQGLDLPKQLSAEKTQAWLQEIRLRRARQGWIDCP